VLGTLKKEIKGIIKIKSEDKYERAEAYCIVALVAGALTLNLGIGLTAISTRGIPAILAMLGSLVSFLATIGLIGVWLAAEFAGE